MNVVSECQNLCQQGQSAVQRRDAAAAARINNELNRRLPALRHAAQQCSDDAQLAEALCVLDGVDAIIELTRPFVVAVAPSQPLVDVPFPPYWESRVDPRSGRVYFVNHMTRTTTFEDPRLSITPSTPTPIATAGLTQAASVPVSSVPPRPTSSIPRPPSQVPSSPSKRGQPAQSLQNVLSLPASPKAQVHVTITLETGESKYSGELDTQLAAVQQVLRHLHPQQANGGGDTSQQQQQQQRTTNVNDTELLSKQLDAARLDFENSPSSRTSQDARKDTTSVAPVRPKAGLTGPAQTPRTEKIPLPTNLFTRVVPSSQERGYSLDGYELTTLIDPNRSLAHVQKHDTDWTSIDRKLAQADTNKPLVLFEPAAMGAKFRNTHAVGGERVKEMEFFINSVETPEVRIETPDVAELLAEDCANAQPVPVGPDVPWQLYVQAKYIPVSNKLLQLARMFYHLLEVITTEVYAHGMPKIRLSYLTTMRADFNVCTVSKQNGFWYVNLQVFEQQMERLENPDRRIWVYWVERIGMINGSSPPGLYDKQVRTRLNTYLRAYGMV